MKQGKKLLRQQDGPTAFPEAVVPDPSTPEMTSSALVVPCTLVVPSHNEAASISACLDALHASRLPPGAVWLRWVVIDDASTDATVAEVDRWRRGHPDIALDVVRHPVRKGKAAGLERVRAALAERGPEAVMVVCDADGVVSPQALSRLVTPFVEDPAMAVTWGWSTPRGRRRRRLASRFQLVLSEEEALLAPADGCPAFGRLFAMRPSALASFRWRPGFVNDDTPLAEHVRGSGAPRRLVATATIAVLPAASYRDFYLQTYRFYVSRAAVKTAGPRRRRLFLVGQYSTVRALTRAVRREPLGLPAYVVARVVAAAMHLVQPATFADAWVVSKSTK